MTHLEMLLEMLRHADIPEAPADPGNTPPGGHFAVQPWSLPGGLEFTTVKIADDDEPWLATAMTFDSDGSLSNHCVTDALGHPESSDPGSTSLTMTWHPIHLDPPRSSDRYLVTYRPKDGKPWVIQAYYDAGKKEWFDPMLLPHWQANITHWMKLPRPAEDTA